MVKKKKEVKIKEIPSKIKEIKEVNNESALEEEIESSEARMTENISSSGGEFTSGILSPEKNAPQSQERPAAAAQQKDEPEFSQSRIYRTGRQGNLREDERRARYVTSEQAMRRINPSISQKNINFNPQSRNEDFANPELQKLRGEESEKKYHEIFEQTEDKPKRRYPWEA